MPCLARRCLSAFYSTADEVLAADIEHLGKNLLIHLDSYEGRVKQHGRLHQGHLRDTLDNRTTGLGPMLAEPEYGLRQTQVTQRAMEAWYWLERQGFLVPDPACHGWHLISSEGKELLAKLLTAISEGASVDPKLTGDNRSIQISGPDDTYLLIEPAGDRYQWRLRNDGLRNARKLLLEITGARSFSASKSAFRDGINLRVQWPLIEDLPAGDLSNRALFVRFEGDRFGFGDTTGTHLLHWPKGDPSTMHLWRLSMRVTGLSREWAIELDLRWRLGTKTLELAEMSGANKPPPAKRSSRRLLSTADNVAPPAPTEQRDNPTSAKTKGLTPKSIARLQALRFALRRNFQDGQTAPLKSWEQVREELRSMTRDTNIGSDLRIKIGEELNPKDDELSSLLISPVAELRREAGKIVIDRIMESPEATQFRTSPEHRARLIGEHHQNMTAQGFEALEGDDPPFFVYMIQIAHQANAKGKRPSSDALSLNREERHDLLQKFSADHLGLSEAELAASLRFGEWPKHCLTWLAEQDFRVKGKPGAPKKAEADKTRAHWAEIGRPEKLTAEVCDLLAKHTYPGEYAKAKLRSPARKRLRDRVRRQVRPMIARAASAASAI
jgi:hypothetical protein